MSICGGRAVDRRIGVPRGGWGMRVMGWEVRQDAHRVRGCNVVLMWELELELELERW